MPAGMESEVRKVYNFAMLYVSWGQKFTFIGIFFHKQDDSDEFECNFGASMQNNIKKTAENLKMKIVPDITENAALNGSSFDAGLTSDAAQWLNHLRQTWLACKHLHTYKWFSHTFQ